MATPSRAAELRALAYTAYRRGEFARARQHFQRVLALLGDNDPETATAHSDLGAAEAALGNPAAALQHHLAALALRRAGADAVALAATLHNLGATHRQLGHLDEAVASHTEAADLWSACLGADHPHVAREFISLAAVHAQRADYAQAEAAYRGALGALERQRGPTHPSLAPLLNNLGIACRRQRRLAEAAAAFTAALAAEPGLVAAQHNLAAALDRLGDTEAARHHRNQALARENVFVQPSPTPNAPRVLILSSADIGNVPLEHLIREQDFTRIWWFPAHGAARRASPLPAYDVVFNGIGDADLIGPAEAAIAAFMRGCSRPVLNDPARVAATRRDLLPATLASIDCICPPVIRLTASPDIALAQHLEQAGLAPPLVLRPAGTHGGKGMRLIETTADLAALPNAGTDLYATPFIDTRAPDNHVRKYRIIYIGGAPYPYHLAISRHWLVHYFSADMESHAWKLAEEAAFLNDWRTTIGPRAAAAITAIGARLGLDYCGIDFTLLPDGRVLVFEANATMLVHPEPDDGVLAFKNPAVVRILDAMRGRLLECLSS